jgi:hypothetical protein
MRLLLKSERPLVQRLFEIAGIATDLDALHVEPLSDGGMGSLSIGHRGHRTLGSSIAKCHFFDSDGVLVLLALNADRDGEPLEVDVWKVDFSPLRTWPSNEQIVAGPA